MRAFILLLLDFCFVLFVCLFVCLCVCMCAWVEDVYIVSHVAVAAAAAFFTSVVLF